MTSTKKCSQHEGPRVYENAEQTFFQDSEAFLKSEEFRAPRKGEWFLSGAKPGAYKAPNDLTGMSYHIAIPAEKTGMFCRQCGQATWKKKEKEQYDTESR